MTCYFTIVAFCSKLGAIDTFSSCESDVKFATRKKQKWRFRWFNLWSCPWETDWLEINSKDLELMQKRIVYMFGPSNYGYAIWNEEGGGRNVSKKCSKVHARARRTSVRENQPFQLWPLTNEMECENVTPLDSQTLATWKDNQIC